MLDSIYHMAHTLLCNDFRLACKVRTFAILEVFMFI